MNMRPVRRLQRYLSLNKKELLKPRTCLCGPGGAVLFSRSSPNSTKANEDSVAIIPIDDNASVLMVADGVGGLVNGQDASLLVTGEVRKAVKRVTKKGDSLREGILNGIEKANKKMQKKLAGSASTIAVAEIQGNSVSTYHVGDSEIIISAADGNITYQSIAHSPVGYAIEAGMLDEEQAIMHDDRHLVSNVVGDADMHIAVSSNITLGNDETLLLATDGLFDNLQKAEITEIISTGELELCGQQLIDEATARMFEEQPDQPSKFDDLSFILFRLL